MKKFGKAFVALAGMALWASLAGAGKDIDLFVGSAQVVTVDNPQRVAIANPGVADVKQISEKELLVSAKAVGSTTLIIWQTDNKKDVSTIVVTMGRAEQTMIQVDVQVLEIRHNQDKNLGFNWEEILGPTGDITLREVDAPLKAIGTLERGRLDALLKLLEKEGNAKILARPKLLTLSGKKASFSSGGEIPVATTSSTGQMNVEWKKFGVNLDILATAGLSKAINIDLRAEVSEADFTHLVQGNPSIKTRWASTVVQVMPENTVVIGGLIQESQQTQTSGIPLLSDIPVLGYLFKETRIIKEESELVIFVTPHVVGG